MPNAFISILLSNKLYHRYTMNRIPCLVKINNKKTKHCLAEAKKNALMRFLSSLSNLVDSVKKEALIVVTFFLMKWFSVTEAQSAVNSLLTWPCQ